MLLPWVPNPFASPMLNPLKTPSSLVKPSVLVVVKMPSTLCSLAEATKPFLVKKRIISFLHVPLFSFTHRSIIETVIIHLIYKNHFFLQSLLVIAYISRIDQMIRIYIYMYMNEQYKLTSWFCNRMLGSIELRNPTMMLWNAPVSPIIGLMTATGTARITAFA